MNVTINMFPLGAGVNTGISRVADQLCKGVSSRIGSCASFHATQSIKGSTEYFKQHLEPLGSRLTNSVLSLHTAKLTNYLDLFIQKSLGKRSFHYRAARRIAAIAIRLIEVLFSKLSKNEISTCDLYHSSFLGIGDQIRLSGQIIRFTTVYDLIPITDPKYFEPSAIKYLQDIVNHLTEDDYTICISNYTRDILLRNSKCLPERCFVVPLAASENFQPITDKVKSETVVTRYGIAGPDYILTLCTFEIRKNLEVVISAFCSLHDTKSIPSNTQLVLVGGKGWKTQNVDEALSVAGIHRDKIVMPGFIPDEDLSAIYSNAKVFIYMSFLEGFGLPPLEAMQCGIPVITSNTSSLPEVVGDAGVMLSPTDQEGLCSAVVKLYHDQEFHAIMSAKAIERSKKFSWDHFISETLECYRIAFESKKAVTVLNQ